MELSSLKTLILLLKKFLYLRRELSVLGKQNKKHTLKKFLTFSKKGFPHILG